MSKTNYLQAVISDLQRTAGPYRCATSGREQSQQCACSVAPPGGLGVRLSLSSYCDAPPIAKDRIT